MRKSFLKKARETLQEMFRKYFPADRSTVVTLVPAAAAP